MPRPCLGCTHKDRAGLDAALTTPGAIDREVARRFAISKDVTSRHRAHISTALVKAAQRKEVKAGRTLLERLHGVAELAERLTAEAQESGDTRAAMVGLREIRESLKTLLEIEAEAGKGAGLDSPDFRAHLERLGDASERMCEPCHALLVAALGGQG